MRSPLRHRLIHEESGYTLIELLTVLIVLGILLAIAVPSYLGLKDRTNKAAAKANLRNDVPAVIQYASDNSPNSTNDPDADPTDSGYTGLTENLLQLHYDPTLDTSKVYATPFGAGYCLYTWVDAWTASQAGPSGPINVTPSSSFNPATCS